MTTTPFFCARPCRAWRPPCGFGPLSWCRQREELRGLARVALTSSVDPRDRERALERGARAVRSRAPDVLELGETVAEILDRWAR